MMILCNTDVYVYICCKYVVLYYSIDCLLGGGGGFNDRGFELGSIFRTKWWFRINGLILDVRMSLIEIWKCLKIGDYQIIYLRIAWIGLILVGDRSVILRHEKFYELYVIPCSGLLGAPHICNRILTKGGHWYGNLWAWTFHSAESFWREVRAAWQSPKL